MNLYFLNNDAEEILVKENVGPGADDILADALEDLKVRYPDYAILDPRCWWDEYKRFWIDYGSHSEFYLAHCGNDYCELNL